MLRILGHAQIQTTMVYVRITPQDVYQQYARAVAQLVRPAPPSPELDWYPCTMVKRKMGGPFRSGQPTVAQTLCGLPGGDQE